MTARLTIVLGPDVLKALRRSNSIRVAAGSDAPAPRAASSRPARAAKNGSPKPGAGGFRAGSLPAKLMAWAGGLKKPFGVPDLMKKLGIKRGHASMLVAYVTKGGALKRVGRGAYSATKGGP